MADRARSCLAWDPTEVATYIQSGAVVFTSEEADTARIAAALERAIASTWACGPRSSFSPARSWPRWSRTAPSPTSPTPVGPCDLQERLWAPTSSPPWPWRRARDEGSDDEARVVGTTLFLHTPGGLGLQQAGRPVDPTRWLDAETAGTAWLAP